MSKSGIQAILFHRALFNPSTSYLWLIEHGFKPMKAARFTENYIRYRITPPEDYVSYMTKRVKRGILFVIGFR